MLLAFFKQNIVCDLQCREHSYVRLCVKHLWFGVQLATYKEKQYPALCLRICSAIACKTMDLCLQQIIMKTKMHAYD